MPDNENPNVLDLLSWHGHDSGGVRVPFRGGGQPIGRVLETPLVARLTDAASAIASGSGGCRWIFLVGGPGNGKSQMVEVFIRALGAELGCERELIDLIRDEFARTPIPRMVEVAATGNGAALPGPFAERVGQLSIVQDASASDDAGGDAAAELSADLSRLLERPVTSNGPVSVFVCCANRGLLARAMATAAAAGGPAADLLEAIVRATGLAGESLASPPRCWPLDFPSASESGSSSIVGCWPLDVESLLLTYEQGSSAVDEVMSHAVDPSRWEASGCEGCTSQASCPLFTNAVWLRQEAHRRSLLGMLRRAELATGQRWNFRAVFSLVAELIVGERDDFSESGEAAHPCTWVHARREEAWGTDAVRGIGSALRLVQRLYPQSLFPTEARTFPSRAAEMTLRRDVPVTAALADHLARNSPPVKTTVRRRLRETVAPILDPAVWSPRVDHHPLRLLEDSFAQSLAIGQEAWPSEASPAATELRLLELLAVAESECDQQMQSIYAAGAGDAMRVIRQLASGLLKRSVGVRMGLHGHEDYLKAYEATIRDTTRLNALQTLLRELLGHPLFRADMLGSFGQARSEDLALVVLEASSMRIRLMPAPAQAIDRPAHDLPVMRVENYPVPLTFGLFQALELKREGCASGSLPASVRALLDRIRQIHAGEKCRSEEDFLEEGATFAIRRRGAVTIEDRGASPRFIP